MSEIQRVGRAARTVTTLMALTALFLFAAPVGAQAQELPSPWSCDGAPGTIHCLAYANYDGTSTWGYPVSNLNNCTNYAAFRLAQNGTPNPGNLGNANSWDANAASYGFVVDDIPAVGSIAQWDTHGYSDPACGGDCGHVAYVDEVGDGWIKISESNYGSDSNRITIYENGDWPDNFIHINDQEPPEASPGADAPGYIGSSAGNPNKYDWYLSGVPNITDFGWTTGEPIIGDWDGDGSDEPGYIGSSAGNPNKYDWYLSGVPNITDFGWTTGEPIIGDWS